MDKDCIFCDTEKNRESGLILMESTNFYILPATVGAMGPGHCLLLPLKQEGGEHILCYGDMSPELDEEYFEMFEKVKSKLEKAFSVEPFAAEMGVSGQSIPHAHTHFVVPKCEHYQFGSLVSLVPADVRIEKVDGLDRIRQVFQKEGRYEVFYEYGRAWLLHTKDYEGSRGSNNIRLRDLFVRATGLIELSHWQEMSEKYQERNKQWVDLTQEVLRD